MSLMPGQGEVNDLLDGMVDDMLEDGLSALERRRALQRAGTLAAEIHIDVAAKGPLLLYLKERRNEALEALYALVSIDPRDDVAIARAQTVVAEYLKVAHWIAARREDALEADRIIQEDYPTDGNADVDYDQA